MEISGVEESVQVMRLIMELLDKMFNNGLIAAEKTFKAAGWMKDKGKAVGKAVGGFLYSKYKAFDLKKQSKMPNGEQDITKLLDLCTQKDINPMIMQLDRDMLSNFMEYAKEHNLLYAFLPDLNTEDKYIEIIYPSAEPHRTMFDIFMDKNRETAKPYTFHQYEENARDEDVKAVNNEMGEDYKEFDAAVKERQKEEEMKKSMETGVIKIDKEQLTKDSENTYKVTLIDEYGKACFLLIAADKVSIKDNEITVHLDKDKKMMVQYTDRNEITIDKNSLLMDETVDKYFTKIPGSKGQKFIFLEKADAEEIYDGKTIKTKLVPDKEYEICDRDGNVISKMRGDELYKEHYDKVATPLEDIVKMNVNYAEMKEAKVRTEEEEKSDKKEEKADTQADVMQVSGGLEESAHDNKSNNVFIEVLPSQITRNESKSVKVRLPEGNLYVYHSWIKPDKEKTQKCV